MSSMTITPQALSRSVRPDVRVSPVRVSPVRVSPVRLTRRGRLVVFTASLLLVLGVAFTLLGGASVATEQAGTPESTTVVTVAAGDTLWDIAAGLADDGGTRAMVTRIERLNALDSAMLYAGQRIRVPAE